LKVLENLLDPTGICRHSDPSNDAGSLWSCQRGR